MDKKHVGLPSPDRRTVLEAAGAAGLFSAVPWATGPLAAVTGDTGLDVEAHKWEDPLPRPGVYPWHCHIHEHEDQEMMLPFEIVPEE